MSRSPLMRSFTPPLSGLGFFIIISLIFHAGELLVLSSAFPVTAPSLGGKTPQYAPLELSWSEAALAPRPPAGLQDSIPAVAAGLPAAKASPAALAVALEAGAIPALPAPEPSDRKTEARFNPLADSKLRPVPSLVRPDAAPTHPVLPVPLAASGEVGQPEATLRPALATEAVLPPAPFSFSKPLQKRRLRAAPPPPAYPAWAEKAGIELSLELELVVDRAGRIKEVRVTRSSGDISTDRLAEDFARRMVFEPAAGESRGRMSWEFRLR